VLSKVCPFQSFVRKTASKAMVMMQYACVELATSVKTAWMRLAPARPAQRLEILLDKRLLQRGQHVQVVPATTTVSPGAAKPTVLEALLARMPGVAGDFESLPMATVAAPLAKLMAT